MVEYIGGLVISDLIIKVKSSSRIEDLLKHRKFHQCDVVASIPGTVSSCSGLVSLCGIMTLLRNQSEDVAIALSITLYVNGGRGKTPLFFLTLGESTLPKEILKFI